MPKQSLTLNLEKYPNAISTHGLAKRSMQRHRDWTGADDLTKRSTAQAEKDFDIFYISTHDLTKRSTSTFRQASHDSRLFQLTTSRRGRLGAFAILYNIIKFQLTTSRRGRRGTDWKTNERGRFQLTTSRRGRQCTLYTIIRLSNISTHDLTKRSTWVGSTW